MKNKIVKYLILSDIAFWTGWGLLTPVFAIFILDKIIGGSALVVGLASFALLITKSILRIPIGKALDNKASEKDDYLIMVLGLLIASLVPFGFIFSFLPWHIYALEFVRALAMACVVPTWYAIFTRHIDKGREAFSWSIESTGIGFAAGIAGAVGAWLAGLFGFKIVFVLVTLFGLLSSLALLAIRNLIFPKDHLVSRIPPINKPL